MRLRVATTKGVVFARITSGLLIALYRLRETQEEQTPAAMAAAWDRAVIKWLGLGLVRAPADQTDGHPGALVTHHTVDLLYLMESAGLLTRTKGSSWMIVQRRRRVRDVAPAIASVMLNLSGAAEETLCRG